MESPKLQAVMISYLYENKGHDAKYLMLLFQSIVTHNPHMTWHDFTDHVKKMAKVNSKHEEIVVRDRSSSWGNQTDNDWHAVRRRLKHIPEGCRLKPRKDDSHVELPISQLLEDTLMLLHKPQHRYPSGYPPAIVEAKKNISVIINRFDSELKRAYHLGTIYGNTPHTLPTGASSTEDWIYALIEEQLDRCAV